MNDELEENADNKHLGHSFYIPVLGTGFSIDTPLKVARYGISSVISLVDDVLIEQVRKFHCKKAGEPYEEIKNNDTDARAKRITEYLNLVDRIVKKQVSKLQSSPFEKDSEITRYYEMLPESSPLNKLYCEMQNTSDPEIKTALQQKLRKLAKPGRIDVNIMTKLDVPSFEGSSKLPDEFNSAMSALRGFAESNLHSAIVFSAGLNAKLYSYLAKFKDFFKDANGNLKKKIIIKVSDYRSAFIQGKVFAKKGLWVSEYRIESGLNCGGHAFPTEGHLLGPVLDEFKKKKQKLYDSLYAIYTKAVTSLGLSEPKIQHPLHITAQGGIGTAAENLAILDYYEADATGWATPFLLVPDVINIDDEHLQKLCEAKGDDIELSTNSPMNILFWNLKTSASEKLRMRRIEDGTPGAPCIKGYLCFNTEFTERPLCSASRAYQNKKLAQLSKEDLDDEQKAELERKILSKACICHDLGASVKIINDIEKDSTTTVCCGPNIRYFNKSATLEEMTSHIYGRKSLLDNPDARPHMFIQELQIYVDHLAEELKLFKLRLSSRKLDYFTKFKENLQESIKYYQTEEEKFVTEHKEQFLSDLEVLKQRIELISDSISKEKAPVLS